jgi:SAM-dependent MidA family methyltransferase
MESLTFGSSVSRADRAPAARFEDWMRAALHDPERGYYARHVRGPGARGDFATASTLHPALGEAVAAWAAGRRGELLGGRLAPWHLVEIGPGTGELALAVLAALPFLARRAVRLHLVETSPVLLATQRARLGERAAWHATVGDALLSCGGRALVYASELLDAFPVRVLRRTGGGWEELWMASSGTGTVEEWRPASPDAAGPGAFRALARSWPEGQRIEIAPSIREFLRSWLPSLAAGSALFLDYGETLDSLYERRPRGTIRGYAHHTRLEGPDIYSNAGFDDLTADVNFTDVRAWGEELGLETARFERQADFLRRFVARADARAAAEPALAFLLDARGAGAAFKALELTRGA